MKKNLFRFLCLTLLAGMTFVACDSNDGKYTITVKSADVSQGKAYGGGDFDAGTTTRIWGTPEVGYQFDRWNDGNTENPRNITVNGDATYTAYFKTVGGDNPVDPGRPTPPDITPDVSFTLGDQSWTGLATLSFGQEMAGNIALQQFTVLTDESASGAILYMYVKPETGTQVQTADLPVQAQVVMGMNDMVTDSTGHQWPHYLSTELTVNVTEFDLTASIVNLTATGTMRDYAEYVNNGNDVTLPITIHIYDWFQVINYPTGINSKHAL